MTGPRNETTARSFGAHGDGVHDDTDAIQLAIDDTAARGGGTVRFDQGSYLCGAIRLRSNVFIELDLASSLVAVTDESRYPRDPEAIYPETALGWIVANGESNIGIVGRGVVDGRGAAFSDTARPQVVAFRSCDHVVIDGITLRDSGSWMLSLARCDGVRIHDIEIVSKSKRNNDGIDLDSCTNVTIIGCRLDCGDDGIALKANYKEPCSNIVVSNCLIRSEWAAIRIGPESKGDFENIVVSNCVIARAWGNGVKIQVAEGGTLRNVSFSNLVMEDVTGPIMIRLSGWRYGGYTREDNHDWQKGVLHDVSFSSIRARVTNEIGRHPRWDEERFSAISITGLSGMEARGLRFRDVHVTFPGGGTAEHAERSAVDDLPEKYPEYLMFGVLPAYALYMHHVEDVVFDDTTFALLNDDHRPAIVLSEVEDVTFHRLQATPAQSATSMVRITDSRRVSFQHSSDALRELVTSSGQCTEICIGDA